MLDGIKIMISILIKSYLYSDLYLMPWKETLISNLTGLTLTSLLDGGECKTSKCNKKFDDLLRMDNLDSWGAHG